MKVPVEVFVIWSNKPYYDEPKFEAWSCDVSMSDPAFALVTTVTIEVEIPADFDPIPQQVATLREHKQKVMAEAQVKANNIDEQIQRLLCIEYKPEAA